VADGTTTAELDAPGDLVSVADRLDGWLEELDEPETLVEGRREAWERYRELPMPQTASEEWRYTDVEDLRPEDFGFVEPEAARSVEIEDLPATVQEVLAGEQDRSGVAVQVDAGEVYRRLDPELEEQGVVFAPIVEVARERPELLEDRLFSSEVTDAEEKFWTLHRAIFSGGYLLYVPENVRVPEPVHAFRYLEREDAIVGSHTLVVAERGAEVTCVEEFLSPDLEETSLSVGGVEVFAGENATVRYISLQRYGRGVEHYSVQHATTGKDSHLSGFNVALGSDRHRADVTSHVEGPGSESEMLALWFGDGDQHIDHHTLQYHKAPHAYSDLLYKGALTDRGRSVFRGVIRVAQEAQLTDAYQTNRNLLLSEDSHANALPNLEIEADDVRCSHGATVGQVDESQLFYLKSRGLTPLQAERLLVFGFFEEVLGRVPVEGVRSRVRSAIERKLGF